MTDHHDLPTQWRLMVAERDLRGVADHLTAIRTGQPKPPLLSLPKPSPHWTLPTWLIVAVVAFVQLLAIVGYVRHREAMELARMQRERDFQREVLAEQKRQAELFLNEMRRIRSRANLKQDSEQPPFQKPGEADK